MTQLRRHAPEIRNCIEECFNCHSICLVTIEHGLEKSGRYSDPELLRVLRDCAEITAMNANFLLCNSNFSRRTSAICAEVCEEAARNCEELGDETQLTACANVCRHAAQACRQIEDTRSMAA